MRIAVDIGFGFVKVMNEKGKKEMFPSVMAKRSDNSLRGIVGGSGDDYSILYWEEGKNGRENEKKLYVGDAGMSNGGTRKWEDKDKFNIDELKIFIATAVGLVNPENEEVDLAVGLPMSYYLEKKDELENILQGINANVSYSGVNGVRKISFNTIFCFPQGAGAYYSATLDITGKTKNFELANSSVGVIDIGYRTVDFLVMAKGRKGIAMVDHQSGSLEEEGMNKAFQMIEKVVSEEVGRDIGLIEIEKAVLWFGGNFNYRGKQINLIKHEEQAYTELAESISSKIKLKWGVDGDLLSKVLVTGGGGHALYPLLKTKFDQAYVEENSSYANCEGYLGVQAIKMKRR